MKKHNCFFKTSVKYNCPPLNFIVLIFLQLTDTLGTVKYVYNYSTANQK